MKAMPSFARRCKMACISCLEPMSTPTVGPLSTSTSGCRPAIWPARCAAGCRPESVKQAFPGSGVAMASSFTQRSISARRFARSSTPAPLARRSISEMTTLSAMERGKNRPSLKRSSGTKPMRASMASCGLLRRTSLPSLYSAPLSAGRMPNRDSASSVRPESRRPVTPRISPLRRAKDTSSKKPVRPSPLASSTGSLERFCGVKSLSSNSRPVM